MYSRTSCEATFPSSRNSTACIRFIPLQAAEPTKQMAAFVFHCEAADDNEPKRGRGLIGGRDRETGDIVAGPTDPTTWKRVEAFARFAVK